MGLLEGIEPSPKAYHAFVLPLYYKSLSPHDRNQTCDLRLRRAAFCSLNYVRSVTKFPAASGPVAPTATGVV